MARRALVRVLLLGVLVPVLMLLAPLRAAAFIDGQVLLRLGGAAVRVTAPARALASAHPVGLAVNLIAAGAVIWWQLEDGPPEFPDVWPDDPADKPLLAFSPEALAKAQELTALPAETHGVSWTSTWCTASFMGPAWVSATEVLFVGDQPKARGSYGQYLCDGVVPSYPDLEWTWMDTATGQVYAGSGTNQNPTSIYSSAAGGWRVYFSDSVMGLVESRTKVPRARLVLNMIRVNRTASTSAIPAFSTDPWYAPTTVEPEFTPFEIQRLCADGSVVRSVGSDASVPLPDACPSGVATTGLDYLYNGEVVQSVGVNPSFAAEAIENYALCVTAAGVPNGACALTVQVDNVPCEVGQPGCAEWWELGQSEPSRVRCMWGPYQLPLADCEPIRHGYRTKNGIAVEYLDNEKTPGAHPERDPATSPAPAEPDGSPLPDTEPLPIEDGEAPDYLGTPKTSGMSGAIRDKGARWSAAMGQIGTAFNVAGSCSCNTYMVTLPVVGEKTLFTSCEGIGATFAGFSRTATGALLVIVSGFLATKFLMASLGWYGMGMEATHRYELHQAKQEKGKK